MQEGLDRPAGAADFSASTMEEETGGGMPMMRVPRQEEYFDREHVLGRDATSVFPSLATKWQKTTGMPMMDPEQVERILGTQSKFVSESELREIRAQREDREAAEAPAPVKSLAEQLEEHKKAKEAAMAERDKIMRKGKNRPLTEDELEFIERLEDTAGDAERELRLAEKRAMAAFQAARVQRSEAAGAEAEDAGTSGASVSAAARAASPLAPALAPAGKKGPARARVAAKRKYKTGPGADASSSRETEREGMGGDGAGVREQGAVQGQGAVQSSDGGRLAEESHGAGAGGRVGVAPGGGGDDPGGLGVLTGYGSSSESD